jgi:hypothetical protein
MQYLTDCAAPSRHSPEDGHKSVTAIDAECMHSRILLSIWKPKQAAVIELCHGV